MSAIVCFLTCSLVLHSSRFIWSCVCCPLWVHTWSRISRMALLGVQDLQNRLFLVSSTSRMTLLCVQDLQDGTSCLCCLWAQSRGHGGDPIRSRQTGQSADDWELLAGQGCENPPITTSQKPEEFKKKRPPTSTCCSFRTFWGCPLLSSGTCLNPHKVWLKCMKLSCWTVLE